MDALTVLRVLDSKGIWATAEEGRLFLEPEGRVTPDDVAAAKAVKMDLLTVLGQPKRDGSPLQRFAYQIREKRLIAECRDKAVELQTWLTTHCDEHMATEPFGMPEWISTLAGFDIVERGHLRGVFHYAGCIHQGGHCPDDAPVDCSGCEGAMPNSPTPAPRPR
jgi:hypothetical protein